MKSRLDLVRLGCGSHRMMLVISVGVLLRVVQYLWNTGFYYDEAMLLESVTTRSFVELIGPLAKNQAAPLGYLWLLRGLYLTFGLSELALRLPSLLASIGVLLLMPKLTRSVLTETGAVIAVLLVAVSDDLLLCTVQVKPYAIDALATVVVLYAAQWAWASSELKAGPLLGLVGAVLFLFSYPSVFVTVASLAVFSYHAWRARSWAHLCGPAAGALLVAAALVLTLVYVISAQRTEFLVEYWGARGFPGQLTLRSVAKWPVQATYRLFHESFRPIGPVVLPVSIVGAFVLVRSRATRQMGGMVLAALALHFLAACLRGYPWTGGRISVYSVPMLAVLAAAGVWAVLAQLPARRRALAKVLVAVVLSMPLVLSAHKVFVVRHRTLHTRPLVETVASGFREGDRVVVYGSSEFTPYLEQDGRVPVRPIKASEPLLLDDLLAETAWQRCWVLVRMDRYSSYRPRELLVGQNVVRHESSHGAELYLIRPKPQ